METTTGILAPVVENIALEGILNEVVGLLPIVIPVAISFLALRKGISFLFGMLHSA